MFYVTLCDMVLYLHKDERSFKQSSASFGTPTSAVRIHHSLATRATDYIKKQHVFRLQTADWSQSLFQARLDILASVVILAFLVPHLYYFGMLFSQHVFAGF